MTIELPPPGLARWTPRRKENILVAVERHELSRADACRRYDLSPAELDDWRQAYHVQGLAGVSITKRRR